MGSEVDKSVTIAVFQGYAELGKLKCNLYKMKEKMLEAKERGADLIAFPELFTTGYFLNNDRMKELAEEKDGNTFLQLSQYAKATAIAVLYGYPELEVSDGKKAYYNSVQFIDKDGSSLANYRKTHLWIGFDNVEGVFTPGKKLSEVFEFCGVKIGLLICYDVEFCETVRALSLRGANIILVPTAIGKATNLDTIANILVPARAFENGVHVAYINHSGERFSGSSRVCDPKGRSIVSVGIEEEGVFLANIAVDNVVSHYLTQRRADLFNTCI